MKFTPPNLRDLRARISWSLPTVLTASLWVAFALLGVLVAADGFIFVRFGLGRPESRLPPSPPGVLRVEVEEIRAAAVAIEARRVEFESLPRPPPGVPNPFQ